MSASVVRKWIELNWLRRGNKEIPLPEIVFGRSGVNYSGCYHRPGIGEQLIDGRFLDLSRGIIVICDDGIETDDFYANTIAHEWRHHWQFIVKGPYSFSPFVFNGNYRESIVKFFKSQPLEMDALLYAEKKAPSVSTRQWIEWLIKK